MLVPAAIAHNFEDAFDPVINDVDDDRGINEWIASKRE